MKPTKVVFLGGVHGVGKSTLAKLCQEFGIEHLRASDLIKSAAHDARFDEKKRVKDIDGNQSILVTALRARTGSGGSYLLDGHFTLFSAQGTVEKIPVETFAAINPASLALLVDKPEDIVSRINSRDKTGHDSTQLSAMQEQEIQHARAVATSLGISLTVINSGDETAFRNWLSSTGL